MKVQIRSFVKGGNHGQYLQSLGLKSLVEQLRPEAEVSHLDYENHFAKELKLQAIGGMLPKFLIMRYFWKKNITFTSLRYSPDISIYGSDMIWHLKSDLFPVDKKLFGSEDEAKYKISYAPSVGARGENEPYWIGPILNQFMTIGVRDRQTESLVISHTKHIPSLVIDPCFHLLNSQYSSWFKVEERKDFVSVYSPLSFKLVKAFYGNLELKLLPEFIANIKYLGYFPRKRFLQELVKQFTDPLWTVRQIAYSRLLITSTFHGVMMALMTKTPFIAITSSNLSARLESPIADTFSSKRLMSLDKFKSLDNSRLANLLNDSDLDSRALQKYINESKTWLEEKLSECDNENCI